MTTLEKRQKRGALVTQAGDIIKKAESEKRSLSGEETSKYEAMMAEVDSLKVEIDREDRQAELEAEMRNSTGTSGAGLGAENPEERGADGKELRTTQKKEYRAAFNKLVCFGMGALSTEERALIKKEEQRALSVGTATAGGYTVPQGFYDQLTEAMKFFGGIRKSRASVLRTATGNALPMPTVNDTGNMGELVAENSPVSAQDVAFGQTILNAYKFSSKTVLVSLELLQDSAFDIETFLARKLGERLGRVQNNYFTIGTGVSQPQGIVTGANLGKTGLTGQTTSVIYDDLVDLEHSVDPAYRADAQYMFHDSTLKILKKLKDGYGRPLWLPGITEKAPDTILGYDYVINNDMAVMAANAKSMIFGDLSNFFVRDVMDVTLFRIGEKYIESGQVGFLAFYRGDSKLLDAGMHPIAYYANSAT